MDVLPIAVNSNALPTPAANGGDGLIGTADGAQEGLDFATLLAAGLSSQSTPSELPITAQGSEPKSADSDTRTESDSAPADAVAAASAAAQAIAPPAVPFVASSIAPSVTAPDGASDMQAAGSIEGASQAPVAAHGKLKALPKEAGGAAGAAAHPAAIAARLAARDGISTETAHPPSPSAPFDGASPVALATVREAALHREEEPIGAAPRAESPSESSSVAGAHATALVDIEQRIAFQSMAVREVPAPVSSSGFADSLSQQVVWLADKDAQVAELHLNPPELGPVEVRLTLSGDEASARFVSPHAEVRAAIESSLVRLRESMAQAGIALGEAFVSAESFRESPSQSQSHRNPNAYDERHSGGRASQVMAAAAIRRGLIDTFA